MESDQSEDLFISLELAMHSSSSELIEEIRFFKSVYNGFSHNFTFDLRTAQGGQ